jgi:hypothetical protein
VGFSLLFDRIFGIEVLLEKGNWLLRHRINLWWGFSVLCDACRYVFFVGNEGIVSRIALTTMMRQWIRSFAIIVGKLGIPLLCAANLFKMVNYLLVTLYHNKLFVL